MSFEIPFLELLKSGVNVEIVALHCVEAFLEANQIDHNTLVELITIFSQECLRAIGFDCIIDAEEISARKGFCWPEHLHTYTFKYDEHISNFEVFLVEFCKIFELRKQEMLQVEDEQDSANCPIVVLMQVIIIWCKVFNDLQDQECQKPVKHFEEPLARLNFHLLAGMHAVRKVYRNELELLDKICDQLYQSAIRGIIYARSSAMILEGLVEILRNDFDLFVNYSEKALEFYYKIFSIDFHTHNEHIMLLNELKKMVTKLSTEALKTQEPRLRRKLNMLTDFLIRPRMQEAYYHMLKSNSKKRTTALLEFLNELQTALTSVDCFSDGFLEGILCLVVKANEPIANAAAELYIKIMRRKWNANEILMHILAFFLTQWNNLDNLGKYVKILFQHFPTDMRTTNVYFDIIQSTSNEKLLHMMAINFLTEILRATIEHFEINKQWIDEMQKQLPTLLQQENCAYAQNLLLNIYNMLDQKIFEKCEDISVLENYVCKEFYQSSGKTYPYLFNIFAQMLRCLSCSGDWHYLEQISAHHLRQYICLEKDLQNLQEQPVPIETLIAYRDILSKLSLILKTDFNIFDNLDDIYTSLLPRLIDQTQILAFAKQTDSLMDVYACEVITYCLLKYEETSWQKKHDLDFILGEVKKFICFLKEALTCTTDGTLHIFRKKTFICCICLLYNKFNAVNAFTLELNDYHFLVHNIVEMVFLNKTKVESHVNRKLNTCLEEWHTTAKRVKEYQKEVLQNFILLHNTELITLPSRDVWKVCIYFGLNTHDFDNELSALLTALALKHFHAYKRIMAVLLLNLNIKFNVKSQIKMALEAHKNLIENNLTQYDTKMLLVHIVLLTVQMLDTTLRTQKAKKNINRISVLKYLPILFKNINVRNLSADILDDLKILRRQSLTRDETKCLENFLHYFEKPKPKKNQKLN